MGWYSLSPKPFVYDSQDWSCLQLQVSGYSRYSRQKPRCNSQGREGMAVNDHGPTLTRASCAGDSVSGRQSHREQSNLWLCSKMAGTGRKELDLDKYGTSCFLGDLSCWDSDFMSSNSTYLVARICVWLPHRNKHSLEYGPRSIDVHTKAICPRIYGRVFLVFERLQ